MGKILCATRGGEASNRTQDAAIRLAKELSEGLIFFYVVDIGFLDKTAAPIVVDAENEVSKLGEFLLLMAKERAVEQGVDATTILCKGSVREEIRKVAEMGDISLIVLGRPLDADSVFKMADLEAFAQEISDETGVETRIV